MAKELSILKKLRRREDGVIAVELAVIFPILAVILFGIIEFGITLYGEEQWVSAARDGARYAAVSCYPDAPPAGCNASGTGSPSQRVADIMCSGNSSCLTNTPTLYFNNGAVAANYCTNPDHRGDLVTLKWTQHVHTIAVPIIVRLPFYPLAL